MSDQSANYPSCEDFEHDFPSAIKFLELIWTADGTACWTFYFLDSYIVQVTQIGTDGSTDVLVDFEEDDTFLFDPVHGRLTNGNSDEFAWIKWYEGWK